MTKQIEKTSFTTYSNGRFDEAVIESVRDENKNIFQTKIYFSDKKKKGK